MKRRIVIDAEPYLFEGACAGEVEHEFLPGVWMYFCNHNVAISYLEEIIAWARAQVPGAEVVLAFGVRDSFRYEVWPDYKGDRRAQRRPAGLRKLYEGVKDSWPWIIHPKLEADDVVGITAQPGRDVILSKDKDMRTLPGLHLTSEGVAQVSQLEGDRNFFIQVLAGDATDGYPGCPGIGVTKAAKALADCRTPAEMWATTLALYEKAGLTELHALTMARCARILRPGEYDHDSGQPLLWEAPK